MRRTSIRKGSAHIEDPVITCTNPSPDHIHLSEIKSLVELSKLCPDCDVHKTILLEGHRGMGLHRNENKMKAFEEAVAVGLDSIEIDTHLSSDGDIVVIHGRVHEEGAIKPALLTTEEIT
jgi:glycerophosphoryl diester phosphodiesterase